MRWVNAVHKSRKRKAMEGDSSQFEHDIFPYVVFASEARQSSAACATSRLLRRFASRNDDSVKRPPDING